MNWLKNSLMFLLISLIDTVCYGLLQVSYNIFYAVAQLDLFGGGSAGTTLYTNISQRIYLVLSVVMVFIFAYQLIMLVINPDKGTGAISQVVRDTLISIILLIGLPLIYRYMAMFQFHVLENGTIPAIIMGTNAQNSDDDPGQNVALMMLTSFFHPNGTNYNTFIGEDGRVKSTAVQDCLAATAAHDGVEHPDTCELYVEALNEWMTPNGWITSITVKRKKLRHWVQDTMDYSYILCSFAALACAYVFFVYAIDIGTRAVKLGVLQLISPIPIILRIFPTTKKSYDTWFNHMKKTYLELFIRVAVIFFALEVIKLIPTFIDILWHAQGNSTAGNFTKCVATAILILGVLKFGQDAVPLFKELFSVGGDLMNGINLKTSFNPVKGVRGRLEENKGLMWTGGKAAGIVGGAKSQYLRQYRKNTKAATDATGNEHRINSAYHALGAGLRGVITGARGGQALTSLDRQGRQQGVIAGADAANKQFNESLKLQGRSQNMAEYLDYKYDTGNPHPDARTAHPFKNIQAKRQADHDVAAGERARRKEASVYERKQYNQRIAGEASQAQATSSALSGIIEGLNNLKENAKDKTKGISKKIDDLQQQLNRATVQTDPGVFSEPRPDQSSMSADEFSRAMEEYNRKYQAHEEKRRKYQEYVDTKRILDEAKTEKNNVIASELNATDFAKEFATTTLDGVLDKLKKAPRNAFPSQQAYNNILDQVTDLRAHAVTGTLTGSDMDTLGGIVKDLTNAKIYSGALTQLQQTNAAPTGGNAGSGGNSGGAKGGQSK